VAGDSGGQRLPNQTAISLDSVSHIAGALDRIEPVLIQGSSSLQNTKEHPTRLSSEESGMSDFRIRRQPASLPLTSGSYCGTQTSRFESSVHIWHPGERGGAVYPEATVASGLTCSSCPEYSRGHQMRGSCVRCPAAHQLASHQSRSDKVQNRQQRRRTTPAIA
jgi:hypothetical protein